MDPMAAEGLTDGMTHLKREKSRNSTTDAILNALDKKKYDGQQKQYRRWFNRQPTNPPTNPNPKPEPPLQTLTTAGNRLLKDDLFGR